MGTEMHQGKPLSLQANNDAISQDRRNVLQAVAAALLLPLCPLYSAPALATPIIEADVSARLAFKRMSQLLTGYQDLNPEMLEQLYEVFRQEPWGMDHLKRVNGKLSGASDQNHVLATLDKGEHWFFGHFLTTWITGIYYHQSGNKMISYEHALMHEAFHDLRPTPGMSDQAFGYWSEAPIIHKTA